MELDNSLKEHSHLRNSLFSVFTKSNLTHTFLTRLCPTAQCSAVFSTRSKSERDTGSSSVINDGDATERGQAGPVFRNPSRRTTSVATKPITEVQLSQWLQKETGWDRLKLMYALHDDLRFAEEDTREINKVFVRSVVIGFFLNTIVSATKNTTKKRKNLSGTQALIRSALFDSSTNKLFLEALKNTAKLTVFAGCVLHLSQAIAAYRNKSSVWEYTISSAIGFGMIAIDKGPRKIAVLALGGSLAGTVCGALICRLLAGAGLDQEQRHMKRIQLMIQSEMEGVS